MLPQFLSKIPRLIMIGSSCLKPFRTAVMLVLVALIHNHPLLQLRHQGIEKLAQICMCSFNSKVFFMNPEVTGLAKY